MKKSSVVVGSIVVGLTAALGVWQGFMKSEPIQITIEDSLEHAIETASKLAGEEIDVEIDIDPQNTPKCMRCRLHCPQE